MSRTQLILTLILAVQVVLLAMGVGGRSAADAPVAPRPFLPEIGSFGPSKLKIESAGGSKIVTLERRGEQWGLAEAGGYPVDETRVASLIEKLAELEVRRPVAAQPKYFETLKVKADDFERHLQLWGEGGGEPRADFYVGTSPSYRITHARRVGEDEVFAVTDLAQFDFRDDPNAWVAKMVPEDLFDEPSWFRLENAGGALQFRRGVDGWEPDGFEVPEGRSLDPEKVESFLMAANSVWIVKPLGPAEEEAQGLATPAIRLEFLLGPAPEPDPETGETPADERRKLVLRVGSPVPGEENQYYFNREDFGFTGAVRDSSVKRLREASLETFLADLPAEPAVPEEED